MAAQKKSALAMQHIRWRQEEWVWLAGISKPLGISRSEFIRRATIGAANALNMGLSPYSVQGAKATSQNTRINFFETEGNTKADTGGGRAPVRSRSDCEAKDGPKSEIDGQKPNGLTNGKV